MNPDLQSKLLRAGTTVGGMATIALNKKFGLGLDMTDVMALSALIVGYVSGSNWKEAKMAGHEAAIKIATSADAATVLSQPDPNALPTTVVQVGPK